jgi:hypothetical protein
VIRRQKTCRTGGISRSTVHFLKQLQESPHRADFFQHDGQSNWASEGSLSLGSLR